MKSTEHCVVSGFEYSRRYFLIRTQISRKYSAFGCDPDPSMPQDYRHCANFWKGFKLLKRALPKADINMIDGKKRQQ